MILVTMTNIISYCEGVLMHHKLRTEVEIAAPIEVVWARVEATVGQPS